MDFIREFKIASDRLGVLVGKKGKIKREIEERCVINLKINSKTGDVVITSIGNSTESNPLKAVEIVTSIAYGFSPERAFRLFDEENTLAQLDLREYSGKSDSNLSRIKGRIIGLGGKSRKLLEDLTGTYVSVYGHMVAVIGMTDQIKLALDAINMLASGSPHRSVYNMLERARSRAKMDKIRLWEGESLI